MDHAEVIQQKIAEKYALGELSAEVREQFEEHYFDCAECVADVEALAALMAAGKVVAKEGFSPKASISDKTGGWFAWLRPVIAVPAIAALAGVLVLQNSGLIPILKRPSAKQPTVQVYESTYRLQGVTRGEGGSKFLVTPHESFALDFDFIPTVSAPSYRGSLLDASATKVFTFTVNGVEANKELHVVVPADTVHAGDYDLVFTADPNQEVQRLSFSIEFRP
jgi:Putative zinc-finger